MVVVQGLMIVIVKTNCLCSTNGKFLSFTSNVAVCVPAWFTEFVKTDIVPGS
jgi:hypothetical protein